MKLRRWLAVFFWLIVPFSAANADTLYHYQLKNGLNLYVKVDKRAPVAVAQLWYRVGSSYEPNGITGISHVLEHMMFEGTPHYPGNAFSRIISSNGGQFNAETSYDYTVYFEEIAADKLPLVLKLEADRMRNLTLSEAAFGKEIKVVQEERRLRTDNNPQALTYERFQAGAFIASPYHHPIVGWMDDLKHMSVLDVRKWYQDWYAPNNAILVIVGDVVPEHVLGWVKKYFAPIPARPLPGIKPGAEVPDVGLRTVTVEIPAKLPWLVMGYNVPSLKTAKTTWQPYALEVAAAILSEGASARLPRDLIRKRQIASAADADYQLSSRLSGLFTLSGIPGTGHTIQQLKQAFLEEIQQLQTQPVSPEELQRIKNQVIADKIYAQDSMSYQGRLIGSLESVGLSWEVAENYVQAIEKVTPAQIQAVAKTYLIPKRLTIGVLNPLPLRQGDNHHVE